MTTKLFQQPVKAINAIEGAEQLFHGEAVATLHPNGEAIVEYATIVEALHKFYNVRVRGPVMLESYRETIAQLQGAISQAGERQQREP